LPSANVAELRAQLDGYARTCLTSADLEPSLEYDAEIDLCDVSPAFHQLVSRMEPFGQGNPEPVFAARAVRLLAPPRTIKEKHVKLKLGAAANAESRAEDLPAREAVIAAAVIPQRAVSTLIEEDASPSQNWRRNVSFSAMGWRLAEAVQQHRLLPGDALDIAFTLDVNEHPEFGGLELSLKDLRRTS
jgi:single-stranded-DNA-specific exonuclease